MFLNFTGPKRDIDGGIGEAALIGGGLGLVGSIMGGNAASDAADATNQAGADARRMYDTRTAEGALRQLVRLYGPQKAERMFRQTFPAETVNSIFGTPGTQGTPGTPATGGGAGGQSLSALMAERDSLIQQARNNDGHTNRQRLDQINRMIDDPSLRGTAGTSGTDAVPGSINMADFNADTGPSIEQQMGDYRNESRASGNQYLSGFDTGTNDLMRQSHGIEQASMGFGDQERQRINRDAATALTGSNRLIEGRMRANGLGTSSVLGNQLAGNAQGIFNSTQDQLGSLGDRQNQFNTGLRQNTMNLASGRRTARDAAAMDFRNQDMQLGAKPIDMALQNATGPAMNPWLNHDATQYFPGASGGAGGTFGNALSAMGGQLSGFGMQQYANNQQFTRLQDLLRNSGQGAPPNTSLRALGAG